MSKAKTTKKPAAKTAAKAKTAAPARVPTVRKPAAKPKAAAKPARRKTAPERPAPDHKLVYVVHCLHGFVGSLTALPSDSGDARDRLMAACDDWLSVYGLSHLEGESVQVMADGGAS